MDPRNVSNEEQYQQIVKNAESLSPRRLRSLNHALMDLVNQARVRIFGDLIIFGQSATFGESISDPKSSRSL